MSKKIEVSIQNNNVYGALVCDICGREFESDMAIATLDYGARKAALVVCPDCLQSTPTEAAGRLQSYATQFTRRARRMSKMARRLAKTPVEKWRKTEELERSQLTARACMTGAYEQQVLLETVLGTLSLDELRALVPQHIPVEDDIPF